MITPAFKILELGNNARAIGSQFPRFRERVAIGIGNAEATAIESDHRQAVPFD